jgi:ornithine carbamoyltransferase
LPAIFKQKKDGKIGTVKNVVNFDEIDEVLDSDYSAVIQQAGNRVWSVQAVIKQILEGFAS